MLNASSGVIVYDESALLARLTDGCIKNDREVVFLVGSALTAPNAADKPGVLGVRAIVELIRKEFESRPAELAAFDSDVAKSANPYQAAFLFLLGRRGQQTANEVIKRAVWAARLRTEAGYVPTSGVSDDACRNLELDNDRWFLNPAVDAIGKLVSLYTSRFGTVLLTSNFDPLIEISIARARGKFFRTVLHRDGDLGQTRGDGCHVIHFHGYWYGADTLHTPRQLLQARPRLKSSLASILKGRTLVTIGYGGWDDVFMGALMELVGDDSASPDILWTLYEKEPDQNNPLLERLAPGIDRGRVTIVSHGVV
jgi:hypothetical protein